MWQLPIFPGEQFAGTLTLEPRKLPVLRVTVPKSAFEIPDVPELDAIHGHDDQGRLITLLMPSRPRTSGGTVLCQMAFPVGYALLGIDVPEPGAFQVNSLMVEMQHLYAWGGITGFDRGKVAGIDHLHICYSCPDDQVFVISTDLSLELRVNFSFTHNYSEKKLKEDLYVAFQSKSGLSLTQCNEIVNAVRHLLHFASLEKVFPLSVSACKAGYGDSSGGHLTLHEIELFSSALGAPVDSEFIPERWMFQFTDVQANFGTFFASWLGFVQQYEEALGCYFSTVYHRLPHEIAHLALTQALDAYYGIKFSAHANSDFKRKVQDLADAQKLHLKGLVDDPGDFAETVIHNRNYYTHHNPKWKRDGRVVSGGELYRLNEKLRLIFQMSVLSDIKIPSDRFVRLRRQLATHIVDLV